MEIVRFASNHLLVVAATCFAALGLALVSQHVFGMLPCSWCVLQRAIFAAMSAVCLVAAAWRQKIIQTALTGVALSLSLAGAAAALWQHLEAAHATSCNLSLADKLIGKWLHLAELAPFVFEPKASCAQSAVTLLGVSYEFWSLAVFVAIAGWLGRRLLTGRASTH